MKKLNLHFDDFWVEKQVEEKVEIENLRYLMNAAPNCLPAVKLVDDKCYLIERCKTVLPENFNKEELVNVYNLLSKNLYNIKSTGFTPGIYKYLDPCSITQRIESQSYLMHLINALKEYINEAEALIPGFAEETYFRNLFSKVYRFFEQNIDWQPNGGYSLLHGDLHIGNLVKKDTEYFLIDYEFLRFGAVELEIANLLISALVLNYASKPEPNSISVYADEYFETLEGLEIGHSVFLYFCHFSAMLFYFSFYIKNDLTGLKAITLILGYLNNTLMTDD